MTDGTIVPAALTVSVAQPADFSTVLDILVEAARWHQARMLNQWFPDLFTDLLRNRIEQQVATGGVYLARFDDQVVGTLTLQWEDEEVWGPDDGQAGYVHRLAVRRVFAGRQYGAAMLEWASERCAQAARPFLRLDTLSENRKLRDYYEGLGFRFLRINPVPRWRPALYQRPTRICPAERAENEGAAGAEIPDRVSNAP